MIALFSGLTVFFLILLIAALAAPENVKITQKEKMSVNALCDKVFKKEPNIVAHKMGIATDKYIFNCNILGIKPRVELIIFARLIAAVLLVLGGILVFLVHNYIARICVAIFFIAAAGIIFIAPTATVNGKAADKQSQFESELPRFLDLLQTALKINMPIASAIKITAERIEGVLSEELINALTVTEIGASNWQDALFDIATKYEVDAFSDFVLDIVSAFQKGSDITESVERQSRDLKTTSLLRAKEKASKVTSLVLIPVVIFKMIPLMAILFIPVILQLLKSF